MRKPKIEPLGEQRWARIERELFDRVASARASSDASSTRGRTEDIRAVRWFATTALVLAGAAAAIGGGVAWRVLDPSARKAVATVGPSRISTDAAGSHVNVGEAILDVSPQSELAVSGDDARGVTVVLERGRIECEVPPRHGRPPFIVEAGDVIVRVVGTHFSVGRGVSNIQVAVQHGLVQVTDGLQRVDVRAGETWPAPALSAPAAVVSATASTPPVAPPSPAEISPSIAPSSREVYESASRLEASRPDLAIATYRELAAKGGPWGMNALYAQGRLEADRGHVSEAMRLLDVYLARYPSGPNANDARQLLERLR
jgi:hypothetical protein